MLENSLKWKWPFRALLAYTLLMLIPVSFQGTLPYLDAAWAYDLNYFVHSHYRFGPDLIFSYGPLGFLDNPQYVSSDIPVAVAVHAVFLFALGWQLLALWAAGKRTAAVLFCVSLVLGHRLYYDYWDYSLLALGLITLVRLLRGSPRLIDMILLPALAGITFLLKFTTFTMLMLMLSVYTLHLVLQQSLSRRLALWLGVCFASGPLAYLVYDRSVGDLAQYVKGAFQIAAGFATALSTQSEGKYLTLAAAVFGLMLANVLLGVQKRQVFVSELLLMLLLSWTVFRHGFVRGDSGHVFIFFVFSMPIFACLFMGSGMNARLGVSFALLVGICLSALSVHYPVLVSSNWWPRQAFHDIKMMTQPANLVYALDHGSDGAFDALPGMAFRNSMEGRRVMVFPNGLPYVAKLNFDMFPLYALQDYAAYTAYLDQRGARNLVRANPPVDRVLFEADVDGRNPVLNSPGLMMAILSNFQMEGRVGDALMLAHRAAALPIALNEIGREPFHPDEWVTVPMRDQLVAMGITLKQNLIGQAVTNLYAQGAVYLDVATGAGAERHLRVPPLVLSTPGIINYVPNSLDDLEKLWKPEPLPERVVKIRLTGPGLRWVRSDGYRFYGVENAGIRFEPKG